MAMSVAVVQTAHASRYLQQLCKHWSHKFEVSFDAGHGEIALPFGRTELTATADALSVVIETIDGAAVDRARSVVAEHLGRFAFREGELRFDWREG